MKIRPLELELSKVGKVESLSRKLLIIDPCYLVNYRSDILEELSRLDMETQIKFIEALHEHFNRVKDHSEEKRDKIIEELKEKFKSEPSLNPPYLAQGKGYVIFNTGIGDGVFPIIQTPKRFHVVFSYLSKFSNYENIGKTTVDSGCLMLVDPKQVKISDDVRKNLYCIVTANKTDINCRYTKEGKSISIR